MNARIYSRPFCPHARHRSASRRAQNRQRATRLSTRNRTRDESAACGNMALRAVFAGHSTPGAFGCIFNLTEVRHYARARSVQARGAERRKAGPVAVWRWRCRTEPRVRNSHPHTAWRNGTPQQQRRQRHQQQRQSVYTPWKVRMRNEDQTRTTTTKSTATTSRSVCCFS